MILSDEIKSRYIRDPIHTITDLSTDQYFKADVILALEGSGNETNRSSDKDFREVEEEDMSAIKDLKKFLALCIKVVYVESYRKVFREIVKRWSEGREDSSYYNRFLEDRVINNKRLLEEILDILIRCGYAINELKYVITKDRRGRKITVERYIYKPTPLGMIMNFVLTLLYPEE